MKSLIKPIILFAALLLFAGCSDDQASYKASLEILAKYPNAELVADEYDSSFYVRASDGTILYIMFMTNSTVTKREKYIWQERIIFKSPSLAAKQ